MKPGTRRFLRALALVPALSCGPEAEERLDRDAIVETHCEKIAACGGPFEGISQGDCMKFYDQEGVDYGANYDDVGCLQEELRYLLCLQDVPCEDIPSAGITEEDPCFEESNAVLDAGCAPLG